MRWILAANIFITALIYTPLSSAEARNLSEQSLYHLDADWIDQNGKERELSDFLGNEVIMTMMYLRCKASCPIVLQKLRSLESDADKTKRKVQFVIFSFDPDSDTPQFMAEFKKQHKLGNNWHFLNGSDSAVREIAALLGFSYQRVGETTEFSHSNRIILLNPKGEIQSSIDSLSAANDTLLRK